MIQTASITN